jgi:ribosomal protein S12 methylthiotransferase accessory factor
MSNTADYDSAAAEWRTVARNHVTVNPGRAVNGMISCNPAAFSCQPAAGHFNVRDIAGQIARQKLEASMSTGIMYRTGTYRSASPESTRERIRPMLDRFSITRVADITHLDEIGIPTMVCYRPDSKTLAMGLGSGIEPAQAWVSCVMESVETWHLEYARMPMAGTGSARAVGLDYDVRALSLLPNSPVTSRTPLDWVTGRGLLTGSRTLAPASIIRLDMTTRRSWQDLYFNRSSNGAATGSTLADAMLHGLFEVIERGCVAEHIAARALDPGRPPRHVNPESATDPTTVAFVEAVAAAGCSFECVRIENSYGLSCYGAEIWSADMPVRCGGFGCHVDPEIAFGRAVSEAAQCRLAVVSGARDDIDTYVYRPAADFERDSRTVDTAITDGNPAPRFDDIEDVIAYCAARLRDVTGWEPFAVDLTQPEIGIPMSVVIAPGAPLCDFDQYRP